MSQLNQQERNRQGYDQNLVFVTSKICIRASYDALHSLNGVCSLW